MTPAVASVNAMNILAFDDAMIPRSSAHYVSSLSPPRDIPASHIPEHTASSSTLVITSISSSTFPSQLPSWKHRQLSRPYPHSSQDRSYACCSGARISESKQVFEDSEFSRSSDFAALVVAPSTKNAIMTTRATPKSIHVQTNTALLLKLIFSIFVAKIHNTKPASIQKTPAVIINPVTGPYC